MQHSIRKETCIDNRVSNHAPIRRSCSRLIRLFENKLSCLLISLKICQRFTVDRVQVRGKFVVCKETRMGGLICGGEDCSLPAIYSKNHGEHLDMIAKCGGKGEARLCVQGNRGCFQHLQSGFFPYLTLEAFQDRFIEFHCTSGHAPRAVITALDEQEMPMFIPNDGTNSRADQGPGTYHFP